MVTINPYLNFPGQTEEAFNFYKSVFGGDFVSLQRFKDVPGDAARVSDKERDKVMHASLPVGNNFLMASDTVDSMGQKLTPGNNFYISVQADSEAEANKIFEGLSKEGKASMPMQKTFWGSYFGMLTDKFGVQWMVNYDYRT